MGKIVGTAPSQISGSVGLYTFRQTKDGTIVSEKVKAKGISNRTLKQCMVQMQMANLQHIYNAFYGALENGFENIPKSQNTRAAFIKANFGKMPVYLIKSAVEVGASVLAPYQITRGSLPNINVVTGTVPRTDIKLGDVTIDADTTLAEFSQAVIANNVGYQNGDQISFFSGIQASKTIGELSGIPFATINKYEVTLDIYNTSDKLYDLVALYGFSTVTSNSVNYLGCASGLAVGAYAWVHSRGTGADLQVSTQFLMNNNADVLAQWTGSEALDKAAESYGGYKEASFLETGSTSSSVSVEAGQDTDTGAVASGTFSIVDSASKTVNNSTSARTQLTAGQVTINIAGTNMTAYDKAVTLKMYASTSATTASTVTATKDADASTASNAVYKATVVSGAQFLGAVEEDGTAIKTWAATSTGGSTGGDDLMG